MPGVHRTHQVLRGSVPAPPSFGATFADDDVELNFLGCRAEIIIRDNTATFASQQGKICPCNWAKCPMWYDEVMPLLVRSRVC